MIKISWRVAHLKAMSGKLENQQLVKRKHKEEKEKIDLGFDGFDEII